MAPTETTFPESSPEGISVTLDNGEVISGITVVAFDLDGTLLDSMNEKANSFGRSAVEMFPELKHTEGEDEEEYLQAIRNVYLETRGSGRRDQLVEIFNRRGLAPPETNQKENWSNKFDEYNEIVLRNSPLFDGVTKLLKDLTDLGVKVIISTAMTESEMVSAFIPARDAVGQIRKEGLDSKIHLLLGHIKDLEMDGKVVRPSREKGIGHIQTIADVLGILDENGKPDTKKLKSQMMFVGDGEHDMIANEGCAVLVRIADGEKEGLENIRLSQISKLLERIS